MVEKIKNLIQMLDENQRLIIDIRKEAPEIKSPADLATVLRNLGWTFYHCDTDGWEPEAWSYYSNKNYNFELVINYNGYYWTLMLFRADVDDD